MILTNFGSYDAEIKVGNRIAQIMLLKPEEVSFEEVSDFNDRTVRATGGFGLTNSKSWFSLAVKKCLKFYMILAALKLSMQKRILLKTW